MQVFSFTTTKDAELIGYSSQRDGNNLPADHGPWKPDETLQMERGEGIAGVGPADPVIEGIERDGYCIVQRKGDPVVTIL